MNHNERVPRVLITRSPHQASELAERLRELAMEPILIPMIELAEPTTFAALDAALVSLDIFHWLLFTSANAVEAFHRRLQILKGTGFSPSVMQPKEKGASAPEGADPASYLLPPASCRIAAIGPATARALESLGLFPDLIPPQAVAESLAAALLPHARQPNGTPTRFLLIRAETARDHLPDTLRAAGAEVTIASAYRTVIPAGAVGQLQSLLSDRGTWPNAITFTSSSTALNLCALLEASSLTLPPEILRISIGPITSQTLRDLNLSPHAEAEAATLDALATAVARTLGLQ